ncbi:MAG: tetratricopeptide repeat protein, partial [Caldilineaceae bacterium]|nr:tetratricopeptide repeat protein [Caldilineaceae bacterium]
MVTQSATGSEFDRLVNAAFKEYHSVLALARSPLAHMALVTPLLVLDDVSPTAEERGHALRLVLEWAVARLAPGSVRYPIGADRPYDDPTWRDPHWWRYNILRHRYLEPLHPDEFVQGGRFTETLLALTGIPSADAFFDERNRAIREVARWLHQQTSSAQADRELQQLALEQVYQPLQSDSTALALLSIAATFDDVFPRALLLEMAAEERLVDVKETLARLTARRFLLIGDGGLNLWLSPVLRTYVYARQEQPHRRQRHLQVARYYRGQAEWLQAARHFQRAGRQKEAARLLLTEADELINELQLDELCETILEFKRGQLDAELWVAIQILLCDLLSKAGRQEEAIAACRRALAATDAAVQQARLFHRMGKLYEKHNQLHALGYYRQAAELFPAEGDELPALLKDRAWLHILRQEWTLAEADLAQALASTPADDRTTRASVFDALASLRRHQKRYAEAIESAQTALVLREAAGDLLLVAASSNNLGLIYNDMGEYDHAIAAFGEAMQTYQALGNRSLIAGALLNIGMANHLNARLPEAADSYRASLAICREIGLPLVEVRAQYNLAESLAELGKDDAARRHWQAG